MLVINKTPHDICIADGVGNIIRTIDPTPPAVRVSTQSTLRDPIDGVPFSDTVFGEVENLPEPETDVRYIVSGVVIAACPDRLDLVRPDTGPSAVRDEDGRIIAVRGLTR